MIATLNGLVSEKLLDEVIVDVNGVGYGVYVTAEELNELATGEKAKLYIYEHVREQAHDLFGFLARDTQSLFELLLNVNGVGPKMALNMLSVGKVDAVKQAIASGDVKYLQQANGVGKRVAERVVVDLKDKVGLIGVDLDSTGMLQSEASLTSDEAVQALMALGFDSNDALAALQGIDSELPTNERVKLALKHSGK